MKILNNMICTTAILALQLSYLPTVKWPKQEEYTTVSLYRQSNQRRLDELFTKDN